MLGHTSNVVVNMYLLVCVCFVSMLEVWPARFSFFNRHVGLEMRFQIAHFEFAVCVKYSFACPACLIGHTATVISTVIQQHLMPACVV